MFERVGNAAPQHRVRSFTKLELNRISFRVCDDAILFLVAVHCPMPINSEPVIIFFTCMAIAHNDLTSRSRGTLRVPQLIVPVAT